MNWLNSVPFTGVSEHTEEYVDAFENETIPWNSPKTWEKQRRLDTFCNSTKLLESKGNAFENGTNRVNFEISVKTPEFQRKSVA